MQNSTQEQRLISNDILYDIMSLWHNIFNLEDAFNFITTTFTNVLIQENKR